MEGKGRITGHTGLLALIGSPVGHSGSPAMYNYSFEKLGLDYAYVAFDIKVEEVKEALDAMRLFHMRGCNVTMPCKTEAAKYMDELSPAARIIGAVNTIVNEDGKLIGHMTDGEGFVGNLRDHGIEIKGKKITVAGGGGAATAIQVQCALDGAREISIFNIKDDFFARTLETAEKIRKEVPGIVVNVYDIADTAKMTEEIQSSSGKQKKQAVPASMEKECCCGRELLHSACIPEKKCRYRKSKKCFSSRIRSKKWSRR